MVDIKKPGLCNPHARGRGAASNPPVRYDRYYNAPVEHDEWGDDRDIPPSSPETVVSLDHSRTILTRNQSPDIPFDRSINPYRGCEHGCSYCFARPTHAHLGFSPGLEFETQLIAKPDAARLLEKVLRKPSYQVAPIAIGTNTDAYQPIERTYRIMRAILEVLHAYRHPVVITTKGALITRDLDILGPMGQLGLTRVQVSLTTLDPRLSRAMEPRAANPLRRLAMIRDLSSAGVPVAINLAPVIPGLNDHEIEKLVQAGAEAGAQSAAHLVLRLPGEVGPLFRDWLARACPDRAARVMKKVQEMHGGRDYDPQWGTRRQGRGVYAELIARRVAAARSRHGMEASQKPLRCDLFSVPAQPGDQLSLGLGV